MSEQDALTENFGTKNRFFKKIFAKKIFKSFQLTNALNVSKRVLSLPMHPNLREDDQDLVIKSLIDVLN